MSKKRLIITSVLSIVLVAVLMIGSTYSIFTTTEVDENAHVYKTGVLDVVYTLSESNVILNNSTPISDDKSCNISPYRVTVTNTGNVPYQFDVFLIDNTSTDVIDYHYIKTQVGILEPLLYSDAAVNGEIIKEGVVVLPGSSVNIDVRVWISEDVPNSEIGKSFYAYLYIGGVAVYNDSDFISNSDLIAYKCANKPNIDNGNLIPVYYDNTGEVWKKADSNNKNNSWYDYDNKMWANAVIKDEDTIVDLSNNLNNGTNHGAKWNKSNGTITTDGVSSYIDCGLANYDFGNTITMVARVKFSDLSGTDNLSFFGNWENGGGGLYLHQDSRKLVWTLYIAGGGYVDFNSNFIPEVDVWYTIVGTYDGSSLALYVNGELAELDPTVIVPDISVTQGNNIVVSEMPIAIGLNIQPSGVIYQPACVTVSDALIFDRALAATEIATYYVEKPVVSDSTDLLLNYDFSDGDDIPVGTTIGDSLDDGTIGFYVWIPRYKYRVWNITRQAGTEDTYAYPAFTKGIEIEWENGTGSTDNVDCTYNVKSTESVSNLSDTCKHTSYKQFATNGEIETKQVTTTITTGNKNLDFKDTWYTHPAFTFGDEELEGFWMGKFEMSGTTNFPTVLPDVENLISGNLSTQFSQTRLFQIYLSRDMNAHMLTNLEWGAVAYLTHSIYGLCNGVTCDGVYLNNSRKVYTGRSGGAIAGSEELNLVNVYPDDSTSTTQYNTTGYYTYKGYFIDYNGNVTTTKDITKVASTTRNITGVYDMSGGEDEYVMGNMVDSSYAFYSSQSGTTWGTTSTLDSIYYNSYAYGRYNGYQQAYNRARLGDATAEVLVKTDGILSYNSWKPGSGIIGSRSTFLASSTSWFVRGGDYETSSSGVFYFNSYTGSNSYIFSFRSSLS